MSKMISADLIKELRERTGVGLAKCKSALEEADGNMEQAIEALRKAGIASAVKKESREANEGRIEVLESADGIAILEMNAETDFVVNNERFGKLQKAFIQDLAHARLTDVASLMNHPSSRHKGKTLDEERKELIAVLGENILVSRVHYLKKKPNTSYGIYSHMNGKILCLVELEGCSHEEAFAKEIGMQIAAEAPEFLSPADVPPAVKAKEEEIAKSQVEAQGGKKPPEILNKIVEGKMRAFYDQACLLNQKYIKDNTISIAELVKKHSKQVGKELKITRFIRWQLGA